MLTSMGDGALGHLRFSLFGVPVRVDASFLVLLFIVAMPVLGEGAGYTAGLAVIVFTLILGHELGHAAAVQALVEPNPSITLYGLGGLTSYQGRASRPRNVVVSLSGPAAGLLVGAVALIAGRAAGGQAEDMGAVGWELAAFWTIANLLPVLPFDGGQALESVLPGGKALRHRMVLIASVITCGAGGLLAWRWDEPILVVFAAWFGLTNLVELRAARRGGSPTDGMADGHQRLEEAFAQLRPATADEVEAQARRALSQASQEARAYVGSALIAALLVQDEYEQAADLVRGLGPEGCAHGLVQLVHLGADAGAVLEERLRSRSSAYDATLYLLDRSLHHDWDRAAKLVEERPPESFESAWLSLATSWAFHAGAFEAAVRLGRVLEVLVDAPDASYNVACSAARAQDVSGAIAALDRAVERGWSDLPQLDADEDLAPLHSTPEWERIRGQVRRNRSSRAPSRRWGAAAGLVATLAVSGLSVRLAAVTDEPTVGSEGAGLSVGTDLVARDPSTGRELWRHSGSSLFPSWVDDDLVLLEEMGAGTRALDAQTGEERWSADVAGVPEVGDRVVVLNEAEDDESAEAGGGFAPRATALDRGTGAVLWSRRDTTAVTVTGDVVVLAPSVGGETVGADATTGAERWSVPGVVAGVPDANASTLVVKDAERLTGVDPRSGEVLWTTPGEVVGTSATAAWVRRSGDPRIQRVELDTGAATPIDGATNVQSLIGDDAGVVVLADGSRRWGVDERSGRIRWGLEAEGVDAAVSMVVGDGLVLEPSTNEVIARDLQTGEVRWRAEVDGVYFAHSRSGVVVASTPGGSVVLDAASGAETWSLGGDEGVAFVGGDDLLISVQVRPAD